jgi:cytoskeleton protein RodZ
MIAAAMGAFGERLQREREMRGITLEQMSEATKITTRCLRALEEEEFERLPGGIFNKGFVRAYARHLGIDEDQAVTDFIAASGGEKEQPLPDPQVPRAVALGQRVEGQLNWQALGLLALVLVTLLAAAWKLGPVAWHGAYAKLAARLNSEPAPAGSQKAPETSASASKSAPLATPAPHSAPMASAPEPSKPVQSAAEVHPPPAPPASQRVADAPSPTPPPPPAAAQKPAPSQNKPVAVKASAPPPPTPAPAAAPAPAQSRSFVVHVRATQDAWVQIVADGKLVSEGVLVPPAEKRVPAAKEVVIKTGNAAGVEVSFNGQPLPTLGEENQMATVTLTAAGQRR